MAAFSSSSSHVKRYHVFPSFHGPDVRRGFLSHLHNLFAKKDITIFKDQEIERGHTIGSELVKAIREARLSIVVLSKNYASSSWCLDELVEILKCKQASGQIVMPVFYEVDPSDVRKQRGDFGTAFQKSCEGRTKKDKQRWSKALAYVATIAGEHSHNWTDEAAMVEKLSIDVSNKLKEEELKEEFRSYDVDQNGFITAAELRYVMTKDGDKVTDEQVSKIIRAADIDGDGRITYDEFVKFYATMTLEEAAMVEKVSTDVSNKLNDDAAQSEEVTDEAVLETLKEAFRVFDKDQNGFISPAELRHVLTQVGEIVNDEDIKEMLQEADVDGDGQISLNEFVKVMSLEKTAMVEKISTDVSNKLNDDAADLETLKEAFRVFDKDQNGFISPAELQHAMTQFGNIVTDEYIEDMIQGTDVDGDGQISFNEFVKLMSKAR